MFLSSSANSKSGYQRYISNMNNTTLQLALVNQTTSSTVYAYVTGQAIQNNSAIFLLKSDGSYYFPSNPPAIGTPLSADCGIQLGAPGSTRTVNIPQIAGGRIWFSIDHPLTFLLNPGPALVEPSVTNFSDPNVNIAWDFCEFTYNSSQLYANISYVDFVSVPIALSLTSSSGPVQVVTGTPANGLSTVCNGLVAQTAKDGKPWSSLIYKNPSGQNLRVLSPNNGSFLGAKFSGYYEPFVAQVYQRFSSASLSVNTQSGWGMLSGRTTGNVLSLGGELFAAPSTEDIFSSNTGPFATGASQERNAIIPRLAAAYNRSTILTATSIPAPASQYYQQAITNHYARIVHAANIDGLGYCHPYDDSTPDGGADQSGKVNSSTPALFTITVGGNQYGNINKKPTVAAAAGATTHTLTTMASPATTNAQNPTIEAVDSPSRTAAAEAEAAPNSEAPAELPSSAAAVPPTPEAGQKPLGAPSTQGEAAAREKAEAASKGPTATPTNTPKAPGPDVAPYPKVGFWKRVLGRGRGKGKGKI